MKDLKILVLIVALKPLPDFLYPFRTKSSCFIPCYKKKSYKAPFLEPQHHARMKDLKISVLMVALNPLHDFSRPISKVRDLLTVTRTFPVLDARCPSLARNLDFHIPRLQALPPPW